MVEKKGEKTINPRMGMSRRGLMTGVGRGVLAASIIPALRHVAPLGTDRDDPDLFGILNVRDFEAVGNGIADAYG